MKIKKMKKYNPGPSPPSTIRAFLKKSPHPTHLPFPSFNNLFFQNKEINLILSPLNKFLKSSCPLSPFKK
jgi:hypothetical protein